MVVAKKVIARFKFFVIAFIICWSTDVHSQEYLLTTSAANIISAKALIDLPALSGKAGAIIVATPTGNTKTLNPHPTGAWYYSGQWNLFNCDFAPLIVGLTYKIQYFPMPGPNQFMHTVTMQNLGAEGSYIDNPALNNHPNADILIFQNHEPDLRGSWLNAFEAKAGYSTAVGKWYITNVGGQALPKGAAYNIVITPAVSANPGTNGTPININNNNTNNTSAPICKCPASLPPDGLAGGDLAGTYPDPMVRKIMGRFLSNTAPALGQVLKWNGTEWIPSNDSTTKTNTGLNSLKTYYKYTTNGIAYMENHIVDNNETKINSISGLVITVDVPSRLIVSANCYMYRNCPVIGQCDFNTYFYYKVNNIAINTLSFAGAGAYTATISNHFFDVPAGTYTIDFYSKKYFMGATDYFHAGGYATVMVLPQ